MISKAIFQHERQLLPLNFTRVRTTEFIAYTSASFTKGDEIKVMEVSFAENRDGTDASLPGNPQKGFIAGESAAV